MLGLNTQTWLGLAVLGAVVSTTGALFGIVLKDFIFAKRLENWRQKRTLEQLYLRYRDPLLLSANELATRLGEINDHYPTSYLKSAVLASTPARQIQNSTNDPYFQKHKLLSSVYRMAALLGWLELYRQEVTYLRRENFPHSKDFERTVNAIRGDVADGQLNTADDLDSWRDTLIFREEQRAIGEAMIERVGDARTVVGFGRFLEALESPSPNPIKRWFPVVSNFFLDLENDDKDFRRVRIKRLFIHLVDLMKILDSSSTNDWLEKKRHACYSEVFDSPKVG